MPPVRFAVFAVRFVVAVALPTALTLSVARADTTASPSTPSAGKGAKGPLVAIPGWREPVTLGSATVSELARAAGVTFVPCNEGRTDCVQFSPHDAPAGAPRYWIHAQLTDGRVRELSLGCDASEACFGTPLEHFADELARRHGRPTIRRKRETTVRTWRGEGLRWVHDYSVSSETGDASEEFSVSFVTQSTRR